MKPPTPEQQRILLEIVEAELAPFKKLLSPAEVDFFRRQALATLPSHPYPAALLRQLTPEPEVQQSGVLGADADADEEREGPAASSQGRGGGEEGGDAERCGGADRSERRSDPGRGREERLP